MTYAWLWPSLGAVPPLRLRTDGNPGGAPKKEFDDVRTRVLADRSQFFKEELPLQFYGNRKGVNVSEGIRYAFWLQGMQAGIKAAIDCFTQFTETDFTADLKKIDVPTLIAHGEDDQVVPIANSALLSAEIVRERVPNVVLRTYPGGSHGLAQTQPDEFNADLLAFIES